MTDKLKPCPFCGGEARRIYATQYDDSRSYSVMCISCRTAIFRPKKGEWDSYRSIDEAIEAWNRRCSDE